MALNEFYVGDPDEVNDTEYRKGYLNPNNGIAFGYFHFDFGNEYKFKCENGTYHYNIGYTIGRNFAKRFSDYLTDEEIDLICIYFGTYIIHAGRVWLNAESDGFNVMAFWKGTPSSEVVAEIFKNLDIDPKQTYICTKYNHFIAQEWIDGNNASQEKRPRPTPPGEPYYPCPNKLVEKIKGMMKGTRSKLVQKSEKLGNMPIAKYNWLIRQEEKNYNDMNKNMTITRLTEQDLHRMIMGVVQRIVELNNHGFHNNGESHQKLGFERMTRALDPDASKEERKEHLRKGAQHFKDAAALKKQKNKNK